MKVCTPDVYTMFYVIKMIVIRPTNGYLLIDHSVDLEKEWKEKMGKKREESRRVFVEGAKGRPQSTVEFHIRSNNLFVVAFVDR